MEPQYSVLIFSKFSQNCQKLFDIITRSGINFTALHSLCIDNEKTRQRVLKNKQLNITVVPSILSVFSNGNVETYEGINAFNWVENIIMKLTPPPPPPPPQPIPPPQQTIQQPPQPQQHSRKTPISDEYEYTKQQSLRSQIDYENDREDDIKELSRQELSRQELERSIEDRGDRPKSKKQTKVVKIREPQDEEPHLTDISSIPLEDEEDNDRHKLIKQPRRIRQSEGTYEEDENLFPGEVIDHRKEPVNTVKTKAQKSTKDLNNIKSKADALALDRELAEKEINKPIKRSDSEFRRP